MRPPIRWLVALLLCALPLGVEAQVRPDSTRRDSTRRDSVIAPIVAPAGPLAVQDTSRRPTRRAVVLRPPLSPRRAFFLSALIPGLAQSRLERGTSGALFAGIELAALAMLRRSMADVREVRRQGTDTIPGNFQVNPTTGAIAPVGALPPRFEATMERSRKLHVEDWTAALIFNHLIAGADAFVGAQLWDVPTRLTMVPTQQGLALVATIRF